jgi:hypothetical protein
MVSVVGEFVMEGMGLMVTAKQVDGLVPQLFPAVTHMFPEVAPAVTVIDVVP